MKQSAKADARSRCLIHGDGGSVRSYLYVDDVAEAFDVVLHRGVVGETYNVGTDKERTVNEVARDIAARFGLPEDRIVRVRDRAFNDRRYFIGGGKLAALGWSERTSWEEGLRRTIDWYLDLAATSLPDADASRLDRYWMGNLEAALEAGTQEVSRT